MKKLFIRAGLALFLLLVLLAAGLLHTLRASLPPEHGTFTVTGLDAQVFIHLDDLARPYVRAETLRDALFAEGWLHANNRLWQMEMFRRAGNGRLSELLGGSMIASDEELWRLGVPQLARQLEENASDAMRDYVAAYVAGVNAAIGALSVSPPEFLLLQHTPAPWTPRDVYALGALMCYQSANNSGNELLRLALFDALDPELAEIFLPTDGTDETFPFVMPPAIEMSETALRLFDATHPDDQPLMPRFAFGSNGWVVSPEKSAEGVAIFAFDSHDALGLPDLFYEVHLFYGDEGRQIRGWSVAGLPGVINGYNERIAWGFTNTGDTQDLFLETRAADNPLSFKDGDTWHAAGTETVEIPVSGREKPEVITITRTRNGPLISEDPPIALRWTVQDLDGKGLDSILELNRARNWEEFTAALDGFAAPALNATYADIDGNIGFRTAGILPVRGKGQGLLPLPGDDPANRWTGVVDPADMPEQLNPPEGFLAAANARVNADGNGPLVNADNAPGYRIRRIRDVLGAPGKRDAAEMAALQMDWFDSQAALILPTLLRAVNADSLGPPVAAARDALIAWQSDYLAEPDRGAALLFQAWYRALATEVFRPRLDAPLFDKLMKNNYPLNHALDQLILHTPESVWWRNDRNTIIENALVAAFNEIAAVQGDDIAAWRLDTMHRVLLEHELGKAVPQLAWFLNATPAPWGGGTSTVGRARYRYDKAYDVTAAATVRVIGVMKPEGPAMSAILPGGQSGHPLSTHYTDQYDAWLTGRNLPIVSNPDRLNPAITLQPVKR